MTTDEGGMRTAMRTMSGDVKGGKVKAQEIFEVIDGGPDSRGREVVVRRRNEGCNRRW